jgi:hypothetical protein
MVVREMVVCMLCGFDGWISSSGLLLLHMVPTVHTHRRRAFVNLRDQLPTSGFQQQISDSSLSPSIHVRFVQARSTRALGMVVYGGGDGEASDARTLMYAYNPAGFCHGDSR